MQLPCESPATTFTVSLSTNGFLAVHSIIGDIDALAQAAAAILPLMIQVLEKLDQWIKDFSCAGDCVIGLIYMPPTSDTTASQKTHLDRRGHIITDGWAWTAKVTGSVTVDCHHPDKKGIGKPHKRGEGLRDIEDLLKELRKLLEERDKSKRQGRAAG